MDKKAIFASALNVADDSIETLSENRFRVGVNEFQVWTGEEAESFGYLSGGADTSDAGYKVYRVV
jgi:hypothetical protein